jgi:hypothetical protein
VLRQTLFVLYREKTHTHTPITLTGSVHQVLATVTFYVNNQAIILLSLKLKKKKKMSLHTPKITKNK